MTTQSLVTHGHLRSQLCCALFCLWARRIGEGAQSETAWTSAAESLDEFLPELCFGATTNGVKEGFEGLSNDTIALFAIDNWLEELEWHIRPDDDLRGRGSGYVVDCLRSVRDAMREPDYESVVKYAVALGHDTDTTACIAGGLAGLREGVDAIPARWMKALRGKEIVEPLVARLLAR